MVSSSINGDQGGRGADLDERHLATALKAAGWSLRPVRADESVELWAAKGSKRYAVQFRRARDARRPIIQALLADAILRGRARRGEFLAVVGAPVISEAMARSIEQYVAEVAPGQPFGYVDARGLVRLHGLGLDAVRAEPELRGSASRAGQAPPRDLFSDLNQWLLKVLVGRKLPEAMLSVPRDPVRSAAELAAKARVSVPAAWRLLNSLRAGGYRSDAGELGLVRDLLGRWRAAAQRPQQRVGAVWVLPGRAPMDRLRRALADLRRDEEPPSACLGLFTACDALGVGHVRGAPISLYVRRLDPAQLERLGLAIAPNGRQPDLIVRFARWPETVFRASVNVEGVPVTDVVQCWLDVSGEPARGAEQADYLWRRVLGPALADGEPPP